MKAADFLDTARLLAAAGRGKPSQVILRRATSTIYYAMFHYLARMCADLLIGTSGAARSKHAWVEVYRSVAHGTVKSACEDGKISLFPAAIGDFAAKFVEMQRKRHDADYNPHARFYKSDVLTDIDEVGLVIQGIVGAPVKDRRAFASWVLFRSMKKS